MLYLDDIQHTEPGAAAEVHLAVRRAAHDRGRVERQDAHLRPARQEVLRRDGRQPVHRERRALPDPGHARQPRRHLQPRRHPRRQAATRSRSATSRTRSPRTAMLAPLADARPRGRAQARAHGARRGRPAHRASARLLGAPRSQEITERVASACSGVQSVLLAGEPGVHRARPRRTTATAPSRRSSCRAATAT